MKGFRGWDWKVYMWAGAFAILMALALLSKRKVMAEERPSTPGAENGTETAGELPALTDYAIEGEVCGTEGDVLLYGNREEEKVVLSFAIADRQENWNPGGVRFRILNKDSQEIVTDIDGSAFAWEETGEEPCLHRAAVPFDGEPGVEAVYEVRISYRNRAGDLLADGRSLKGSFTADEQSQTAENAGKFEAATGTYYGPAFILDHRPPQFSVSYTKALHVVDRDGNEAEGIFTPAKEWVSYYNGDITAEIEIVEGHGVFLAHQEGKGGRLKDFTLTVNGKDFTEDISWQAEEGELSGKVYRGTLCLFREGEHVIRVSYSDAAGNKMEGQGVPGSLEEGRYTSHKLVLDKMGPQIGLDFEVPPGSLADAVNYKESGYWFSEETPEIKTKIRDGISGIREVHVTLIGENGEEQELFGKFSLGESKEWEGAVSPETEDFKGAVQVQAVDWCGNTARLTRGCIVESAEKHSRVGKAEIITKTAPSRTVKGVDYYRGDVEVDLKWQNLHAGLKHITYTMGDKISGEVDYGEQAGRDFEKEPLQELVCEHLESRTLEAAANNRNGVQVQAGYVDNAGHARVVEKVYNIDTTPPVITVEYDKHEPVRERYFSQARTATVTIRERNFDPEDVKFQITGPEGGSPTVSGWNSRGRGDDTENWCTVTFDRDGDYTFSVAFQDLAGNPAAYDRVDSFTIDQTPPRLKASYDNDAFQNMYYFARGRRLVVEVLEHNFDRELMKITVHVEGEDTVPPRVSSWTDEGDVHRAYVSFEEDGAYRVGIAGEDLAGHALPDYPEDYFVIDQTPPVVEIKGIRDQSANKGVVAPEIHCSDENYDPERVKIHLTGSRSGPRKTEGDRSDRAGGMKLRLKDIPHAEGCDDRYVLLAEAWDLAGNRSQDSVAFSVNRFGSVYTFSKETEALVGENGKYYTRGGQDIVVTETNVDTLEFKGITLNLSGRLKTLREGVHYKVTESGSEADWKAYTYFIDRDNFTQEGEYLLTIFSRDRAGNSSASGARGKRIAFAVDRTAPSVLISGVEDKGRYMQSSRQVTLDIQDNLRLEEVKVTINGEEQVYSARDMAERGGKLTLAAESAGNWQKLEVTARDAAGNIQSTGEVYFLVTPNAFIQFFMNPALFLGVSVLVTAFTGGVATLAFKKGFTKS